MVAGFFNTIDCGKNHSLLWFIPTINCGYYCIFSTRTVFNCFCFLPFGYSNLVFSQQFAYLCGV